MHFISILCSVHVFCTTAACINTPIAVSLSHSNTSVTVSPAQRPAPAHTRHLAAHSRSQQHTQYTTLPIFTPLLSFPVPPRKLFSWFYSLAAI